MLWKIHAAEMRTARASLGTANPAGLRLIYPDSPRVTFLLQEMADVHDGVFSRP